MKKSIGRKIVKGFFLISIFSVFIIEIFLIIGFRNSYYKSMENKLENKILLIIDTFNKFYSDKSLEDLIIEDVDPFWARNNSEVQIIDKNGYVVYDSIGALTTDPLNLDTFIQSEENFSIIPYSSSYTEDYTMSIIGKLKDRNSDVVGFVRLITSMRETNNAILKTSIMLGCFGLFVIIATIIIAYFFARSIVKPMEELKSVAEKLADGQYKVRSNIKSNDELGQLSRTLNSMAEEIIKKEQIKNDFISSISHELRTPLTSIKGWAVVLKSADENEKELMEDGLNIIENESDRLAKMVEELLDFSRFISGRITLEKDAFNIVDTCRDVAKQMKVRTNANKIEFIDEISDDKVIVMGDENRFRQLLINLMDNAIKFTSENGWVKIKTYKEDDKFNIFISDNGVGISKKDLLHVKEKFYKGRHSKSHSGIGLSICDEIAKLHGGRLDIYSEEKIGTTVRVVINAIERQEDDE